MDGEIQQVLQRYREALEKILEEAPVGSWLCTHEDFGVSMTDDSTFVLNQNYHIIADPSECKEKVRKSQYGPKE